MKEIINKHFNNITMDEASFYAVALFAGTWLCLGNYWSILSTYYTVQVSKGTLYIFLAIYIAVVLPVITFTFIELIRMRSWIKWIVISEIITFAFFVITPPRNADAMRVWLAKVYDVWMNGKKLIRPYWHYFTPDAFTLFHLPLINLWDGQLYQLSIWTALCGTLILIIKISRSYMDERWSLLALCLFLFNPLIILASTVILTDMPILLAVSGLIYAMILYDQGKFDRSLLFVVLFTAFGMNIKYNMLMFLPVLLFWIIANTIKHGIEWRSFPLVLFLASLAILPYILNYIHIGNPVWPALVNIFPSANPYFDQVALMNSEGFVGGVHPIWSFFYSFLKLFLMPEYINPLAMLIIFLIFRRYTYLGFMPPIMISTYFIILWIMMPFFADAEKQRYVLYIFPIMIPLGMSALYHRLFVMKNGQRWGKILERLILFTIVIYGSFTIFYSLDAFRYFFTGDKVRWHRATWYYEEYDWINRNIKLDGSGKILVIVNGQQTYYLKKPYVSAGGLSALIDWRLMTNRDKLMDTLSKYEIQYIFVDEDYLKSLKYAKKAIDEILIKGNIAVVRRNDVKLSLSRLKNEYVEQKTILYKIRWNQFRT
jgi:hypothetical protein